jgi:tRNA uridine 5-carboxymethylaminomethyl modification enzyme
MASSFEVIVIGGGHAGAEAAWAAARMGVPTALVTMRREAIGRMSCNPAIGGIGKGQMVREIDALGGLMGLATDRAGIQFRILNRRKGPAVWAPRAQCDRELYAETLQDLLGRTPNLSILEGTIETIDTEHLAGGDHGAGGGGPRRRVCGVRLGDGRRLTCRAVIVTTGTFLRGLMHTGERQTPGGRIGEASSEGLSATLGGLGFELGRLKTGTPPRVDRNTIDYGRLEEQPGDTRPAPFSFMNDAIGQRQVSCWITYTGEAAHELIRANLYRAPMYSGQIRSRGPRYCPSIEDKVVRFAEKPRHQVFLEPEGYESDRIYCNGISTSLPVDVQEPMVRSIAGLEEARVVQWGYAVEYDFVPPHQTRSTLETKLVAGLYLAGQINGTSGYEEAAGQGILAGINAARAALGEEPLVLRRDQAYLGVMVDDLVTNGTIEPYRMFTSRAEYRLLLRSENADARLTPIGREMGLVDDGRWARFERKQAAMGAIGRRLEAEPSLIGDIDNWLLDNGLEQPLRHDWEASPLGQVVQACGPAVFAEAAGAVRVAAMYGGYIRRQEREVERFRRLESRGIPEGLDFRGMKQLRLEARERLASVGPRSIGQARRISGISPADIAVVLIYLEREKGARKGLVRQSQD